MKKFIAISLILFLILLTAFVKNSAKRIDDEIFVYKENIRILEKEYGNSKLEYDYLSSAEKLLEFQRLYFEDELINKNIEEIFIIKRISNKLSIEKLNLIED